MSALIAIWGGGGPDPDSSRVTYTCISYKHIYSSGPDLESDLDLSRWALGGSGGGELVRDVQSQFMAICKYAVGDVSLAASFNTLTPNFFKPSGYN